MWPALIFAAKRNDKVKGRTIILVVSIKIKNGFNQSGAPSGKRWATVWERFLNAEDKIKDIHKGKPNDSVKIKCLVILNVYGAKPIRLIAISVVNKDTIIDVLPFILIAKVRVHWVYIKDINKKIWSILPSIFLQYVFLTIWRKIKLEINKIIIDLLIDKNLCGSNVEKISYIIQNMDKPISALKANSFINLIFFFILIYYLINLLILVVIYKI